MTTDHEQQLDSVQLAVLTSRFESIIDAMMNTLFRTGRSNVLNTGRDFSCCIVTADHELLVTGESLPVHVMSGPDIMARTMAEFHPRLSNGDAYLNNSPYHGCSHAADHTMLVPVIDDEGVHRYTIVAKAHQADCGNSQPTTYAAAAKDIYEEGALFFPCVKVQEDYRDIDDILRMCRMRIRVPDQWYGDYLALVGAARIGQRRLNELAADVGWDHLERYQRQWLDYAERRMTQAIRELPSGRISTSSAHDPFPGVPDGIAITAEVEIDSDAGRISVDLRDNPDCQPCGLNLSEACSRTSAMVGVFNSIDYTIPKNAGSFRRIDIHLRENCVAGIPSPTASCSMATTGVADRVINAVQRGIADLGVGGGMAEVGPCLPPSCAVISGRDPRRGGADYVNALVLPGLTGGAGTPHSDGWLTATHAGSAGLQVRDSAEIDELRYPIVVWEQRIVTDSEGAGEYRGAPSAHVEYGPVGGWMDVAYASDGNINPALGAAGGHAGGLASQYRRTVDGELEPIAPCDVVRLQDGERIVSISTAGGGYGPPSARDVERVRHDVVEGWITPERARELYRVAVDPDGTVDEALTQQLRASAPA